MMSNNSTTRNIFVIFVMAGLIATVWAWRRGGAGDLEGWGSDLTDAVQQSRSSGKPILVYFTADWCPPCRTMKSTTWSDPQVRDALGSFVAVKVDVDQHPEIAQRYSVQSIPRVLILDGQQRAIGSQAGLITARQMVDWLHSSSR
jgi:thioredoxin-like negative regulator of GroEL